MDISRDEIRAAVAAQLGSAVTGIADTDDLIQMGLNSMRMMSLAGGWRKRGSGITFADLAGSPTIERWHALLVGGEMSKPCNARRSGRRARAGPGSSAVPACHHATCVLDRSLRRTGAGRCRRPPLRRIRRWSNRSNAPAHSGIATGRGPSDAANPIPAGWNATDDVRAGPARLQRGRPAWTESGRGRQPHWRNCANVKPISAWQLKTAKSSTSR